MSRYHREVGFPEWAGKRLENFLQNIECVIYSPHAKSETLKDRYHIIPVIKKSTLKVEDIFEIETEGNCVVKAVFRIKGENSLDNCYAVTGDGVVKTCWTNTAKDSHRTLDKSVYVTV